MIGRNMKNDPLFKNFEGSIIVKESENREYLSKRREKLLNYLEQEGKELDYKDGIVDTNSIGQKIKYEKGLFCFNHLKTLLSSENNLSVVGFVYGEHSWEEKDDIWIFHMGKDEKSKEEIKKLFP